MRVHSSPRTAALESSPLWATPHARRAVERACCPCSRPREAMGRQTRPSIGQFTFKDTAYKPIMRARGCMFSPHTWRQGSGLNFYCRYSSLSWPPRPNGAQRRQFEREDTNEEHATAAARRPAPRAAARTRGDRASSAPRDTDRHAHRPPTRAPAALSTHEVLGNVKRITMCITMCRTMCTSVERTRNICGYC